MPNTTGVLLAVFALIPLAWGGSSSGNLRPRQQETQDMPRSRFGPVPWGEQLGRDDFPCVNPGQIAFTFEDGPSPYTPSIVNTMLQYSLKASFFMASDYRGGGLAQPVYQDLARFMYDQGHLLGSHSYSHDDLRSFTEEEVRADLLEMEDTFVEVLGVVPTYFRPPFTECDVGDCLVNIRPLGYHIVDFNFDSYDNDEFADPADLVTFFRDTLENADVAVASYIVRLHDNEEATANGLFEDFITIALNRGFEVVTVGQCLGDDPGNFYRNPQTGNALGDGNEPPPSPDPSTSTSVSSSNVDPTSFAIDTTGTPETTGNSDTMISDTQTSTATGEEATITHGTLTQETLSVTFVTIDTTGSGDLTITETQTSTQAETDTTDGPVATTTPAVTGTSDVVITFDSTPTITQIPVSSAASLTISEQATDDVSQTTLESSLDATSSLVMTELVSQTTAAATSQGSQTTTSPPGTITGSTETLDITTQDAQTSGESTPGPSPTSASDITSLPSSSRIDVLNSTTKAVQTSTPNMTATPSLASDMTLSHPCATVDETQTIATATTTTDDQDANATAHFPNHIHYASGTTITHTAGATYCPTMAAGNGNTPQSPPMPTGVPQNSGIAGQETGGRCSRCQDGAVSKNSSLGNWLTMTSSRTIGEVGPQSAERSIGGIQTGGGFQTHAINLSLFANPQPSAASVNADGAGDLPSGAETGGVGGSSAVPTRVLDAGGLAVRGSGCAAVLGAVLAWMVL
ncbi:hypothetical protein PspLS_05125 [Pyricularia sp. CBS 133598]|nr:hypothetical protein PspLS_05125 [Pyricularia sp. CBS 133598]